MTDGCCEGASGALAVGVATSTCGLLSGGYGALFSGAGVSLQSTVLSLLPNCFPITVDIARISCSILSHRLSTTKPVGASPSMLVYAVF